DARAGQGGGVLPATGHGAEHGAGNAHYQRGGAGGGRLGGRSGPDCRASAASAGPERGARRPVGGALGGPRPMGPGGPPPATAGHSGGQGRGRATSPGGAGPKNE